MNHTKAEEEAIEFFQVGLHLDRLGDPPRPYSALMLVRQHQTGRPFVVYVSLHPTHGLPTICPLVRRDTDPEDTDDWVSRMSRVADSGQPW